MSAFDVVNNRDLTVWSFVANNLVETPLSFRLPKEEKKKRSDCWPSTCLCSNKQYPTHLEVTLFAAREANTRNISRRLSVQTLVCFVVAVAGLQKMESVDKNEYGQ
jgi:hypothetical protein